MRLCLLCINTMVTIANLHICLPKVSFFIDKNPIKIRDGNGEGRKGTNLPVSITDILHMSPFPSELLERIHIPSPNNNRGSSRVSDLRIINTFFCFRFWVNHIKIKNSNKSKVGNISYINIPYKSHIH